MSRTLGSLDADDLGKTVTVNGKPVFALAIEHEIRANGKRYVYVADNDANFVVGSPEGECEVSG